MYKFLKTLSPGDIQTRDSSMPSRQGISTYLLNLENWMQMTALSQWTLLNTENDSNIFVAD
jgi:hypothetical protein